MIVDQKTNKKIVGVYLLDKTKEGAQLATTKKPSRIRRFFIQLILGWKWMSIKNLKK